MCMYQLFASQASVTPKTLKACNICQEEDYVSRNGALCVTTCNVESQESIVLFETAKSDLLLHPFHFSTYYSFCDV